MKKNNLPLLNDLCCLSLILTLCGVVVAALSFVAWFCACVRETVVSIMLFLCYAFVCLRVGSFLAALVLQVFTIGNPLCFVCAGCIYSDMVVG